MSRARIETVDALRSLYPPPVGPSAKKVMPSLEKHSRRFLELCPFLVLATAGDASPKGAPPGFVRVLDDKTILIPDRVGNNRVDSMQNVLADPRVALLCFLPGLNETLRINGRAEITADPELLAPSAVRGKAPKTGLVVHIDEVFMHCGNAVLRGIPPTTSIARSSRRSAKSTPTISAAARRARRSRSSMRPPITTRCCTEHPNAPFEPERRATRRSARPVCGIKLPLRQST